MVESPRNVDRFGLDELKALCAHALEDFARLKAENKALREEVTRSPAASVVPDLIRDAGRDCRDTFLSLMKTCAKQSIRFWDYLGDRLGVPGALRVPYLPDLIAPTPEP